MKKLSCLFLLIVMIIGSPSSYVFAESGGSYQSEAGIGFTGEYEYPGESEGGGSTAGDESDVSGGGSSSSNSGENQTTLPQTGDITNNQMMLVGLIFVVLALSLIYKRNVQKAYGH